MNNVGYSCIHNSYRLERNCFFRAMAQHVIQYTGLYKMQICDREMNAK